METVFYCNYLDIRFEMPMTLGKSPLGCYKSDEGAIFRGMGVFLPGLAAHNGRAHGLLHITHQLEVCVTFNMYHICINSKIYIINDHTYNLDCW